MLNKNTVGVKKANQKQHANRLVRSKALISAEAKKLLYQKYQLHDSSEHIFHSWLYHWPPFCTKISGQVTKPIVKNML